jgi:hypothetical protein
MDPVEMLNKKKDQEIEALSIKELFRHRILLTFHGKFAYNSLIYIEITDFDFQLPHLKKNSLALEYTIFNITKTYKLHAG